MRETEFGVHLLQWHAFGFGRDLQHPDQLADHGDEEDAERDSSAERPYDRRERERCDRGEHPVGQAAQRLATAPDPVREDLEMNTQITEPCPNACAAMNTIRPTSTRTDDVVVNTPPRTSS